MKPFRSILVDVDASATAHPALERAIRLANASGATLTIVDILTVPPHARQYLPPAVEERLVQDRRQQLARLAAGVAEVRAEAKLLAGRPATALIEEVLRSNHDLLTRSHARDLAASGARPFGTVDLELLRKCPCPVLLSRHGRPSARPRIACAVDVSADDPDASGLTAKIVDVALALADYLQTDAPTFFHAWTPFAEGAVRRHASPGEFGAYLENARQRAAAALARIARPFAGRFDDRALVLRRGEPHEVIPAFVVSEGVDLLVMGTIARAGIPGMFIGNTAERVLGKLPCSVLTVKPDGFVSPVRVATP